MWAWVSKVDNSWTPYPRYVWLRYKVQCVITLILFNTACTCTVQYDIVWLIWELPNAISMRICNVSSSEKHEVSTEKLFTVTIAEIWTCTYTDVPVWQHWSFTGVLVNLLWEYLVHLNWIKWAHCSMQWRVISQLVEQWTAVFPKVQSTWVNSLFMFFLEMVLK